MSAASTLIQQWLEERLSASAWQWFDERQRAVKQANSIRERDITLGLIPRKLGRSELALSEQELADAQVARPGWDPSEWTVETAARALLLCQLAERNTQGFSEVFRDLSRGADLSESMTLLRVVPLLPHDATIDAQVGEGLRTNMRAVFEAIAHRNPYPREHFDENRWNHMVLKALFIDSTLWQIQGLDERANEELARILCDYAHERWAAHRAVTSELWRCVGPFAQGALFDDLSHVVDSGTSRERDAALLAVSASPDARAASVLERHPEVAARIADATLTWKSLTESPT